MINDEIMHMPLIYAVHNPYSHITYHATAEEARKRMLELKEIHPSETILITQMKGRYFPE